VEKLKAQVTQNKGITEQLEKISALQENITTEIKEQSVSLDHMTSGSDSFQAISEKIKVISEKMEEDFAKFKIE